MDKIKEKIDYKKIAGIKTGENWSLNSPKKLHHGLSETKDMKVNDVVQQSLNKKVKSNEVSFVNPIMNNGAERNSGQRAFAKKRAARSHYITKK